MNKAKEKPLADLVRDFNAKKTERDTLNAELLSLANQIQRIVSAGASEAPEPPSQMTLVAVKEPFPEKAKTIEKILWVFQHVIKKAVRSPEFERIYSQYEDRGGLSAAFRTYARKGFLSSATVNNNNNMTFYGLNEWVTKEGGKFRWRPGYGPVDSRLQEPASWKFTVGTKKTVATKK